MNDTQRTEGESPPLRLPRRRRSAARTPALLQPVQLPEDAAGRVEVIAIRAPADVVEPADTPAEDPAPQTESALLTLLLTRDGWIAVGILAAVLVVVFLIGVGLTR